MENNFENVTPYTEGLQARELSESIKLIKNTKGYSWELRILSLDIDKLRKINNEMIANFGCEKDEN